MSGADGYLRAVPTEADPADGRLYEHAADSGSGTVVGAVGSVAFLLTANGTAAGLFPSIGDSAFALVPTGNGAGLFPSIGDATYTLTVNGIGAGVFGDDGDSSLILGAAGVGSSLFGALGSSSFLLDASGAGAALTPSVGSSAFTLTANGEGGTVIGAVGECSMVLGASGLGAEVRSGEGSCAFTFDAIGVGAFDYEAPPAQESGSAGGVPSGQPKTQDGRARLRELLIIASASRVVSARGYCSIHFTAQGVGAAVRVEAKKPTGPEHEGIVKPSATQPVRLSSGVAPITVKSAQPASAPVVAEPTIQIAVGAASAPAPSAAEARPSSAILAPTLAEAKEPEVQPRVVSAVGKGTASCRFVGRGAAVRSPAILAPVPAVTIVEPSGDVDEEMLMLLLLLEAA